ncbi:MAG TPA: iron-containing redox enzyme family protein [Burkholderiaceae bacterium]|nr:iron-containing redox enzyme family protein [Burkholderiaceae bacterium]
MPYFEVLTQQTAAARAELFTLPVIADCLSGRVTRTQYLAFLTEAYHHVKHTVPLLMACGSRMPESKGWLRTAIVEYIAEEAGHEEWILNDIAAAGGNPDAVRHGTPSTATELMIAYVYDTIARRNPVGFFGMVHVLEGTSTALATSAAQVMRKALELPPEAFTYLTSHGALDQQHVRFFAGLMDRLEDPADQAAVTHAANIVYRLYGDIFRGLPRFDAAAIRKAA